MRLIVIFLFLFFLAQPIFAIDTPVLTSPSNNSTLSSIPTFSWQAVSGSVGYNILIDDEPTVTSPYVKTPYYPTNPSYSPQTLNPGTYYWKVKAKDSSGQYGNFSNIWSFTLQSTSSSPSPTPAPSPTPTPSSTSSSSTSSSFAISNTPSQVYSNQSFTLSVILSLPSSPDSTFYLKGAFKKADSSNYFGLTRVSGSWIKNGNSYSSQYPITTDSSGNWSGDLEVQPDSKDSGFIDSGDYIFKVARYTSSGSGPIWSNESTINIVSVENSDQVAASADNSPPSTSPSSSPQSKQLTKNKAASGGDRLVYLSKGKASSAYHNATVAAATTSASPPTIAVKTQKNTSNFISWIGTGLILTGTSLLAYIYLRSRGLHETISNFFRKRN